MEVYPQYSTIEEFNRTNVTSYAVMPNKDSDFVLLIGTDHQTFLITGNTERITNVSIQITIKSFHKNLNLPLKLQNVSCNTYENILNCHRFSKQNGEGNFSVRRELHKTENRK